MVECPGQPGALDNFIRTADAGMTSQTRTTTFEAFKKHAAVCPDIKLPHILPTETRAGTPYESWDDESELDVWKIPGSKEGWWKHDIFNLCVVKKSKSSITLKRESKAFWLHN